MWFKNLRIYSFRDSISVESEKLRALAFVPCGDLDHMKYGFVPPIPGRQDFIHSVNGFIMVCCKKQEKVIPAQAVKDLLEEKIQAILSGEGRHVGRKERGSLKDEIIFSMLPTAPKKSSLHYAYVDLASSLIVCNHSSASAAEDLISKLREALGSLRCYPIALKDVTTQVMTRWLRDNPPEGLQIGDECELKAGKDGRVIRAKNHDLSAAQVLGHIESGMHVNNIALSFKERIHFTVDSDFAIKKLKFSDSVSEQSNDRNPETRAEQFDADFFIMTGELRVMIDGLVAAFGGLAGGEE
jgi:recombination associated protein RdgC